MTVAHVEVLVEEPSAEAALRVLLPRILGDTSFEVYPHSCKDELLERLPDRLRGDASWLPDDWRIVVVVDRDDDDCDELKKRLESMAHAVGLATRSKPEGKRFSVINRLANRGAGVLVLRGLGSGPTRVPEGERERAVASQVSCA